MSALEDGDQIEAPLALVPAPPQPTHRTHRRNEHGHTFVATGWSIDVKMEHSHFAVVTESAREQLRRCTNDASDSGYHCAHGSRDDVQASLLSSHNRIFLARARAPSAVVRWALHKGHVFLVHFVQPRVEVWAALATTPACHPHPRPPSSHLAPVERRESTSPCPRW